MASIYSNVVAHLNLDNFTSPDFETTAHNIKEKYALRFIKTSKGYQLQGSLIGINTLNEALDFDGAHHFDPSKSLYIASKRECHRTSLENVERFMVESDAFMGNLPEVVTSSANFDIDVTRFCYALLDKTEQITEYLAKHKARIKVKQIQDGIVRVKIEQHGTAPIEDKLKRLSSDCTLAMSAFQLSVHSIRNPKNVLQTLMDKINPDLVIMFRRDSTNWDIYVLCLGSRICDVEAKVNDVIDKLSSAENQNIAEMLDRLCDHPTTTRRKTTPNSDTTSMESKRAQEDLSHVSAIPVVVNQKEVDSEPAANSIGEADAIHTHKVDKNALSNPLSEEKEARTIVAVGDDLVMEYLLKYRLNQINEIGERYRVDIKINEERLHFEITGQSNARESMREADLAVSHIAQDVFQMKTEEIDISRVSDKMFDENQTEIASHAAEKKFLVKRKGNMLQILGPAKMLEKFVSFVKTTLGLPTSRRYLVQSLTENTDEKTEPTKESTGHMSLPTHLYNTRPKAYTTKNGIWIYAWETDITKLHTDVIVNAANEYLQHAGGVAYAIATAAGPELNEDSARQVASHGKLEIAGVYLTTAGQLPAKKVMHTVGPQWNNNTDSEVCAKYLFNAFFNCMIKAHINRYDSIAFPAISSGIYGVPIDMVAQQALEAVCHFTSRNPSSSLKHIHFVDIQPKTVLAFQEELDRFRGVFQYQAKFNAFYKWLEPNAHLEFNRISNTNPDVPIVHDVRGKMIDSHENDTTSPTVEPNVAIRKVDEEYKHAKEDIDVKLDSVEKRKPEVEHMDWEPESTFEPDEEDGQRLRLEADLKNFQPNDSAIELSNNFTEFRKDPERSKGTETSVVADAERANDKNACPLAERKDSRDKAETCSICMENPQNPKILDKCKHRFCAECIDVCFKKTQPKCPTCGVVYGKCKANQPNGTMSIKKENESLPGYEDYGTFHISYDIPDGVQTENHPNPGEPYKGTTREAFLPVNGEGRKVLQLLRKAFDVKMIFTVGTSSTTSEDNCVIWNCIHHKTARDGGSDNCGYPDAEYLSRVQEELAAQGIK